MKGCEYGPWFRIIRLLVELLWVSSNTTRSRKAVKATTHFHQVGKRGLNNEVHLGGQLDILLFVDMVRAYRCPHTFCRLLTAAGNIKLIYKQQ
jgi:hypothetical protein